MGSSSTRRAIEGSGFPPRLFARNCYPTNVRINSYSRPQYLVDVLAILKGTSELDRLLASPLGQIFQISSSDSSLSGQLLHQLLCRQLCTSREDELWFVFGGFPLRFGLREFERVTHLNCRPLPPSSEIDAASCHADGSAPYWYKLLGGDIGSVTVDGILHRLKTETSMPRWKKFRLCLLLIVEGVLLCSTQPVRPTLRVVEMVKDVELFLNYPWGHVSFLKTISLVKAGLDIKESSSLISRLSQCSMVVHGFPLALQLWSFQVIPILRTFMPICSNPTSLRDRTLSRLPALKCFHPSTLLAAENSPELRVILPDISLNQRGTSATSDSALRLLESDITDGFLFTWEVWHGGDASLPPIRDPRKRDRPPPPSRAGSSSADDASEDMGEGNSSVPVPTTESLSAVVDARIAILKDSIIAEVRQFLMEGGFVRGSFGRSFGSDVLGPSAEPGIAVPSSPRGTSAQSPVPVPREVWADKPTSSSPVSPSRKANVSASSSVLCPLPDKFLSVVSPLGVDGYQRPPVSGTYNEKTATTDVSLPQSALALSPPCVSREMLKSVS